jgi:hypothetical protein
MSPLFCAVTGAVVRANIKKRNLKPFIIFASRDNFCHDKKFSGLCKGILQAHNFSDRPLGEIKKPAYGGLFEVNQVMS